MLEVHKKIVKEIVNEYKKNKSTVAITLFGSLARGEERYDSDVDIQIISGNAKKWELKQDDVRYGIKIDLVICPEKHLIYQFDNYPYLCYDYLNEKIIYDPKSFIKGFQNKIRKYISKHPEVAEFWEDKLKIMKENKRKGKDPKDAINSHDEAEILFSDEHNVTRNFFRD